MTTKMKAGKRGSDKAARQLKKICYIPGISGSFGGVNTLKRVVGSKISTSDIKKWLRSQATYTLHMPIRRHFKRRRIVVADIAEQWEADLVDLCRIVKYNKPHKYLLTVIDTLNILGTFYEKELQKVDVSPEKTYKFERILAERGRGRTKEYLVKWDGYPAKFNSWVRKADVQHL
ncbi:uncharacterized protein LOC135497725 [Lineus longissimus]|uniref:uncharacterized protein LOC135497725 n=1 Tax=Lineus longissimus TaxID=88925 RepID=UPI00315C7AAA